MNELSEPQRRVLMQLLDEDAAIQVTGFARCYVHSIPHPLGSYVLHQTWGSLKRLGYIEQQRVYNGKWESWVISDKGRAALADDKQSNL